MNITVITGIGCAIVGGGVLVTRVYHSKRRSGLIAQRLRELSSVELASNKPSLLVANPDRHRLSLSFPLPRKLLFAWERLLYQNNLSGKLSQLSVSTLLLMITGFILAVEFGLPIIVCLPLALALATLPTFWLIYRKGQLYERFVNQLPAAIDLMVSVLRSGHSIPQAVQSVAEEIPAPCGAEFSDVLQRIKLGQSLTGAISISCQRFESFDLDLINKAVAIQSEVGGSLGELLHKTNETIRQRIKLARQVKALTAQSRLTALIIGIMPFALAAFLQAMNPGYLIPLVATDIGKLLLSVAVVLQILGLIIMTKLSSVKV